MSDGDLYGAVLAHREGKAAERVMTGTVSPDPAVAQAHADRWTRHHGHGDDGTDRHGTYAYADRVSGARAPHPDSSIRIPTSRT